MPEIKPYEGEIIRGHIETLDYLLKSLLVLKEKYPNKNSYTPRSVSLQIIEATKGIVRGIEEEAEDLWSSLEKRVRL